jgi:hypothetical protein
MIVRTTLVEVLPVVPAASFRSDQIKYTNFVLNWSALPMTYHVMIPDYGCPRDI